MRHAVVCQQREQPAMFAWHDQALVQHPCTSVQSRVMRNPDQPRMHCCRAASRLCDKCVKEMCCRHLMRADTVCHNTAQYSTARMHP
jgi:hypothetical protein